MSDHETSTSDGAFARALTEEGGIRRLLDEVIAPLQQQERELDPAFRPGFRSTLPYFRLLDTEQQEHLRRIFRRTLPDSDVAIDEFERDEKLELDVFAEMYVSQAQTFLELMARYDYEVAQQTRRSAAGRIVALSLSCSLFVLDVPNESAGRPYRYHNIYGNIRVEPAGVCRLKGHPKVGHRLRSNQFTSSPLLLLAVHPSDRADESELDELSGVIRDGLSSRAEEISRVSRASLIESGVWAPSEDGSDPGREALHEDSDGIDLRVPALETGVHQVEDEGNGEDDPPENEDEC